MSEGAAAAVDPDGRLRAALDARLGSVGGSVSLAIGWATVDLDRMERDFADAYAGSVTSAVELPNETLLGARCRLIRPGVAGVPPIVLLEPTTEGRLAATLARHGEGPAAIWLQPDPARERGLGQVAPTSARSAAAPGPFGTEVLALDGPVHGPHRIIVLVGPGTITP